MTTLSATVAVAIAVVVVALALWLRARRARNRGDSAYGHWQREQTILWHGRPVTVTFDYAPYLREPSRRRINVHTLQKSQMGESTIIGLCHDTQEEQVFKIAGIKGSVLIQRTGESVPVTEWVASLESASTDGTATGPGP